MNATFLNLVYIVTQSPIINPVKLHFHSYIQTQSQEAHRACLHFVRPRRATEPPTEAVNIFIYLDSDHFVQGGREGVFIRVSHTSVVITGTLEDEIIVFS